MDKIWQEKCPGIKAVELAAMLRTPAVVTLKYLSPQLLAFPRRACEAGAREGWWAVPTTRWRVQP